MSTFLKNRYNRFLGEISGTETVGYIAFSPSSVDELTGDVTESSAYSAAAILLPCRVDYFPSKSIRALAGREISFNAVLRVSTKDMSNKGITKFKIGDGFILSDNTNKVYANKIVLQKQMVTDFIEVLIFVTREARGRG